EHPKAPAPAKSETLKIVGLSASPNGYPIVALEGGQRWELYNFDGFDPKLTSGTAVTIQRASLGSFLLTTPGGRTHRVRRCRAPRRAARRGRGFSPQKNPAKKQGGAGAPAF